MTDKEIQKKLAELRKDASLEKSFTTGEDVPVVTRAGKVVGEIFDYSKLSFGKAEFEGTSYIGIFYDGELFGSPKTICIANGDVVKSSKAELNLSFYDSFEGKSWADRAADICSRKGQFKVIAKGRVDGQTRYIFGNVA